MRAVKSFLLMSLLFKESVRKISIVSEMADPLGDSLATDLENAGMEYAITTISMTCSPISMSSI